MITAVWTGKTPAQALGETRVSSHDIHFAIAGRKMSKFDCTDHENQLNLYDLRTLPTNSKVFFCGLLNMREKYI